MGRIGDAQCDAPALFRFAGFELDESRRELRRDGVRVGLQPRAFDLLRYLIRNRERVVTKEELLARVWPGEEVSCWSLTTSVRRIRRSLGREGESLIHTLRGFGVGFVGTCEEARGRSNSPVASEREHGSRIEPTGAPSPAFGGPADPFERLLAVAHQLLDLVERGRGCPDGCGAIQTLIAEAAALADALSGAAEVRPPDLQA